MDGILDVFQNRRINKNAADVADSRRSSSRALGATEELRAEVEQLKLVCNALWEMLRDNLGVTEEQLVSKIREVDLRSGDLDGKAPDLPKTCSACDRTVNARHIRCLYCGAELGRSPF